MDIEFHGEAISSAYDPRARDMSLFWRAHEEGHRARYRKQAQTGDEIVYRSCLKCNGACSRDKDFDPKLEKQELQQDLRDHREACADCRNKTHDGDGCGFARLRSLTRRKEGCQAKVVLEITSRNLSIANIWLKGRHMRATSRKNHLKMSRQIRNWIEVDASRPGRTAVQIGISK